MITREVDYGIRMVLALSRRKAGTTASTGALAAEMDIPLRFLRRIVRKLVAAKIVASHRGSGGGVRLARPRARVRLTDVVNAISPSSLKLNTCTVHPEMVRLQRLLEKQLRGITFDKLA